MAKKSVKKPPGRTVTHKATDELHFDAKNPRLAGYLDKDRPTQAELLEVLWTEMAVDELAMSIAASGFFDFEPLFVIRESSKLIVVEGNRRLAAVKLLLSAEERRRLRATDLPRISRRRADDLQELPVVVLSSREEAWPYLGFKHVNGPAKWDSYPKAQYIAEVKNEYGVSLTQIAEQIGDKHRTVQRLYRALMVIEQAESEDIYHRRDRYKKHFSFSHLYTGLDYDGVCSFLAISGEEHEARAPVPNDHYRQLGELCVWLFGSRSRDLPPVVQSQNPHLRHLDEVLQSEEAVEALRAGLPLGVALEISYGDEHVFSTALFKSKETLQKARATLSTGFHGETHLVDLAGEVSNLAQDLYDELRRKVEFPSMGGGRRRPQDKSRGGGGKRGGTGRTKKVAKPTKVAPC